MCAQVDRKKAIREARAKAPAADQFAQSKMKAEIVNPYKQNWILAISLAIGVSCVSFELSSNRLTDKKTCGSKRARLCLCLHY